MKTLILLCAITFSMPSFANDSTCGTFDPVWNACASMQDCTVADDGCGNRRLIVNKRHLQDAQKFYTCMSGKSGCRKIAVTTSAVTMACDSYGIHAIKQAQDHKSCTSLGTLADYAVNNGDVEKLKEVITKSGNVDMTLSHINETPLTLAALNHKNEVIRWLLKNGAKINHQTTNGYTALMFAVLHEGESAADVESTVKLLLSSGADKSLKNSRGETALDQAKLAKNEASIRLLEGR